MCARNGITAAAAPAGRGSGRGKNQAPLPDGPPFVLPEGVPEVSSEEPAAGTAPSDLVSALAASALALAATALAAIAFAAAIAGMGGSCVGRAAMRRVRPTALASLASRAVRAPMLSRSRIAA